jgi:aspartate aminotransferase
MADFGNFYYYSFNRQSSIFNNKEYIMTISKKIASMITRSSWIRKMFEEGARLKAEHGADRVYDFSLGNPNLQPPEEFRKVLIDIANASGTGDHAYMPNIGYPHVRKAVADYLATELPILLSTIFTQTTTAES